MKQAKICIWMCFLFLQVSVRAQQLTQTIRGTVYDKDSRAPLIGASVTVIGSEPALGAVTDVDGNFRIVNVPVGRKALKVSYLGYNDVVLNDVIVNSAKEVVLNVEAQEKVVSTKEVLITSKRNRAATNNELVLISGRSFTIDQTQRYAGGMGDPSRMAASFAGVSGGGNDQRNDIVIRGNSPIGLLWRLEGADIPNPNHFGSQGANGGPVSILNNNLLANSDFLTGAFPAEYGNANSGVFDLKMRNGNNERREFIGQIGFGGVELLAEGPFSRKDGSSYLASYRYSTLSVFHALGISFGKAGIPRFQDLSFKLNFPRTAVGSISLFGLGGLSATELLDSRLEGQERKDLVFPQDIDYSSRMGAAGLSHSVQITKSTYLRSVLSASGESNITHIDTLNPANDKFPYLHRNTEASRVALHSYLNHKFNARSSVRLGGIVTRLGSAMYDSLWITEVGHYFTRLSFSNSMYLSQYYANWNYRFTENLTLNSGVHYNHLHFNNTSSVDPRLGIRWQFTPRQSVSIGVGHHGQIQPLPTYFTSTIVDTPNSVYVQTNRSLGMSKAMHYVLGYDYMITDDVRIKIETYYQDLYNLPVTMNPGPFSTINFGADFAIVHADSLVNNGVGRNYGVELTLERFFGNGYYYLLTASVYNSEYRASDGIWRNTAFNGNFVFNALAGKEWKVGKGGNNTFGLSLKVNYSGGKRYVPVNIQQSILQGEEVRDENDAYRDRLRDFFRTDLKISFRKNTKRFAHELSLDIQNLLNTQNVLQQQWNPKTNTLQTSYQIGFFPVPFYRVYF